MIALWSITPWLHKFGFSIILCVIFFNFQSVRDPNLNDKYPENWCFWTVVLEKTLESPLDCKEIPPVLPKGNQSWVFIGRTDAEAQTPILWPPYAKSWLIWKNPDSGKDWRQEEKGMTEDEMVGWHHRFSGLGFGWTWELMMDREAWGAVVHEVAKSQTWLSDWTELNWTQGQNNQEALKMKMISIQQTLSVKLHSTSSQILLLPLLFPSKPSSQSRQTFGCKY